MCYHVEKAASNYAELRHQTSASWRRVNAQASSIETRRRYFANLAKRPVCFSKLTWMLIEVPDMIGCPVFSLVLVV